MLEHSVRELLNRSARRFMAVQAPLKVTLTNWPEGQVEMMTAINNPEDESAGTREVPFSGELYVEATDFLEDPPRKFHRLKPGGEVRLRYGYIIQCQEVVKNDAGEVVELKCTYDPETRGGNTPDGRKVRGTIHWVSAPHAVPADVRLYEQLFTEPDPSKAEDYREILNPDSLTTNSNVLAEPGLAALQPGDTVQFERTGYFCVDPDSTNDRLVFNRTTTLRDSWAKIAKKG